MRAQAVSLIVVVGMKGAKKPLTLAERQSQIVSTFVPGVPRLMVDHGEWETV